MIATLVTREFPVAWSVGDEPYYPVGTADNQQRYAVMGAALATVKRLLGGSLGQATSTTHAAGSRVPAHRSASRG